MTGRGTPGAARPSRVRLALDGHSLLGVGLAALLYLVCLSGAVAVFADDIAGWEDRAAPVSAAPTPAAIDRALAAALRQPGATPVALMATLPTGGDADGAGEFLVKRYDSDGGTAIWSADGDGVLGRKLARPWSAFIGDLHISLTASGLWGRLVVGVAGVALLALLLTGILAHPRIFRDAFVLRLDGARRLGWADVHNRLAVWGLPFHLALALTGALLGLGSLLLMVVALTLYGGDMRRPYADLAGPAVAADPAPAPLPPVAALLAGGTGTADARPAMLYIEQPGTRGQRLTLEMRAPRPAHLVSGERYYFAGDGRPLGAAGLLTGGPGLRVYGASVALHCGTWGDTWGGLPVRLLYGALGLGLALLPVSGMGIWFHRRRDQGRPLPRLWRLWTGWLWGVPLALAGSLAAAHGWGASPLTSFWVVAGLAPLIALVAGRRGDRRSS